MVKSRIVSTLAGLVLVGACSSPPSLPVGEPTPSTTTPTKRFGGGGGGWPGASNRVSEQPWWETDSAETEAVPPDTTPIDATFELSSDLLFEVGSAELGSAASSQLNHLARTAERHPAALIEIIGHTDNTPGPTDSYNQGLSVDRARSVRQWLITAGVDEDRIQIVGRGADEPIASNDSEAGRSANRRVTITIEDGR